MSGPHLPKSCSDPTAWPSIEGYLYVGNNDAVVRFSHGVGQRTATGQPERLADLPVSSDALDHDTAERLGIDVSRTRGFNHWTRNLVFSPDATRMYVAIGSATNAMPGSDSRRAAINEYRPDGTEHAVYASGLRNPVAMAFHPTTGVLWTAVHERDHLGDDLAPDFVTSVTRGGFYGWPYAYIGPHPEPILNGARPDLVGAHSDARGPSSGTRGSHGHGLLQRDFTGHRGELPG